MTDNNEDFEIIQEKSEDEIKAEFEAESRKKYADLAIQANAENKVIYQHENGEYELVDQETYNTCIFDGETWVEDENKLAEYKKVLVPQTLSRAQALTAMDLTPMEDGKTLLNVVEDYMKTLDTSVPMYKYIKFVWENSIEFNRHDDVITTIAAIFKITDEQLDDMFIMGNQFSTTIKG